MQLPANDHSSTANYSSAPNGASASTYANPCQFDVGLSSGYAINSHPDNFESNVAGMQPGDNGYLADTYLNSQLSDVDVTIENIW